MRVRPNPSGCATGVRCAMALPSLIAGGLLTFSSAAVAQPFQPGQTTQTRVNWAGVTIPGSSPTRLLSDFQANTTSTLTPPGYGFSALINGGIFTFNGTGSAISSPTNDLGNTGVTVRSAAGVSITNNTVAGTSFNSTALSAFADAIGVAEVRERLLTTVTVRLNFTLRGLLTRQDATGRWTSRITLNETDWAGGSARSIYTATLGSAPVLLGTPTGPAIPGETSRVVDVNIPLEFQVTIGGPQRQTALALNAFTAFAPGNAIGLSGSAAVDFLTGTGAAARGLRLNSIQLVEPGGDIVPSHLVTLSSALGRDYAALIVPTPGVAAVLVVGTLGVVARRRRPRAGAIVVG